MGVRPEDVDVADDSSPRVEGLTLSAKVEVVEPLGREDLLGVVVSGVNVRLLVDKTKRAKPGDLVDLVFNMNNVQFFDPETEESLLWA